MKLRRDILNNICKNGNIVERQIFRLIVTATTIINRLKLYNGCYNENLISMVRLLQQLLFKNTSTNRRIVKVENNY